MPLPEEWRFSVPMLGEHFCQRDKSLKYRSAGFGVHALPENSVLTANAFMTTLISHHMEEFLT